ncbi:MAG: radical SAM protein [Bacillota bacterium]
MRLKRHAMVRREAFGGLVLCDDLWHTVLFVKPEVVDAIESGEIPLSMQEYLAMHNVVEAEKPVAPKPEWREYELQELKVPQSCTHLAAPISVALEITNRCNLSCIHCANRAGRESREELTTGEVMKLFDEWLQLRVFMVTITGGEPFSRKDMVDLLQYADERGLHVFVLTNGLLITPRMLERIPRSVGFQLSIDGLGDQYEYIRGPGTFRRLLQTIELLRADRRPMGATLVFTKRNSRHAKEVLQFCLEKGIRLKVDPLLPLGRALDRWDDLAPDVADAQLFLEVRRAKIEHFRRAYKDLFPSGRPFNVMDLPEILGALFLACEGGRSDLWVRYDGRAYPCANLSAADEFMLGSVRESSCETIWNESATLQQFRKITWQTFKKCSSCEIADYCTYRCPAFSLFYHGDFRTCGANDFTREVIKMARDEGITDRVDGQ